MVMVDSNVLIDLLVDDPAWRDWCLSAVRTSIATEGAAINPIIFAEITPHFVSADSASKWLAANAYAPLNLPYEAAFAAGQAFRRYKNEEKGEKGSPMPDFYIGAHAQVAGLTLLTRDIRRYQTYFPTVRLIHPASA